MSFLTREIDFFGHGGAVPPLERKKLDWSYVFGACGLGVIGVSLLLLSWDWNDIATSAMLLVFAAIGLILVADAGMRRHRYLARGAAMLVLEGDDPPRLGGELKGYMRFRGKAVPAGARFGMELASMAIKWGYHDDDGIHRGNKSYNWSTTREETALEGSGDVRLPVSFKVPDNQPPSSARNIHGRADRWYLTVRRLGRGHQKPYRFEPHILGVRDRAPWGKGKYFRENA